MKLLFPCHPLKAWLPDPDYEPEFAAAREAGFDCEFYSLELLRDGDATGACAALSKSTIPHERILHRGWMMTDVLYAQLHQELVAKSYLPSATPEQYAAVHYLPYAYAHLAGLTPESEWIVGSNLEEAWAMYRHFSDAPALVKDFVKSAKHKWNEACFIPPHTTHERFKEIIQAFLQTRGHQFNKGIVLRRFHELVTLEHDIRGQPVHEEYRMFFWNGELLAATPAIRGSGPFDELKTWTEVARRFQNPFISMDVARQQNGTWIIIEVGDGGVSGLPFSIEPSAFYAEIYRRTESN